MYCLKYYLHNENKCPGCPGRRVINLVRQHAVEKQPQQNSAHEPALKSESLNVNKSVPRGMQKQAPGPVSLGWGTVLLSLSSAGESMTLEMSKVTGYRHQ